MSSSADLLRCYTNHALDQFLKHLLAVGILEIIRIGGQSRSPELEGFNLRAVSQSFPKTKHEGFILGSTYKEREDQMHDMGKRLATLHKIRKGSSLWQVLQRFLERRYPTIYSQLTSTNADGFTTVEKDPLDAWLRRGRKHPFEPGPNDTADVKIAEDLVRKAEKDINSLSPSERRTLADHWTQEVQTHETERLFNEMDTAEELQNDINSVHDEVNRRALLTADVIGITTTGFARDISTLRKLRSKVIVCEEAAEVMEAHMISALMPGVEHFIQIGDHQQLRPQINNFSLSMETARGIPYQLDRSQFERLAVGQPGLPIMPIAQLNVQRRMRPQIANLIRKTMYPRLEDHSSVADLPNVVGMRDNVFWLNHNNMEDTSTDDGRLRSHSNEWEVGMTKGLVRHLVRQGAYTNTDIAVITPYTGQLQKLRLALSQDFEICLSDRDEETLAQDGFELETSRDVQNKGKLQKKQLLETLRLATVDNFQGEEAKVIIVSLVRSNAERKPGFLRTKNRINVLLSRAQHGLYLIGNADTCDNVPMWADVLQQLEESSAIGDEFNLCCPRHQDTPIRCAEPDDFLRYSPEGGCTLPCDRRLVACGHKCQTKCHSESMHLAFLCPQPCPRVRLTCEHTCPKLCGEECGLCLVKLNNVRLPCGHIEDGVPCYRAQKRAEIVCTVLVKKKVARCSHLVQTPCCQDVNSDTYRCPTSCEHSLECGHLCPGSCGTCKFEDPIGLGTVVIHKSCKKRCGRPRNTCGHACPMLCHVGKECPPCDSRCEVSTTSLKPCYYNFFFIVSTSESKIWPRFAVLTLVAPNRVERPAPHA